MNDFIFSDSKKEAKDKIRDNWVLCHPHSGRRVAYG
jgi:hypothetical protein